LLCASPPAGQTAASCRCAFGTPRPRPLATVADPPPLLTPVRWCGEEQMPAGINLSRSSDEEGEEEGVSSTEAKRARLGTPSRKESCDGELASLAKRHEAEMKALAKKQADELAQVKARIDQERASAVAQAEHLVQAQDTKPCCLECAQPVRAGEHFVCALCAKSCALCSSHKTVASMTTCSNCDKSYCKSCVRGMHKCASCAYCPQLTCCDLEEMPCGMYEHGDCQYDHHKHCRCERDGR
jgi:hypothetical protein